jgi:GAF domain-containing protein
VTDEDRTAGAVRELLAAVALRGEVALRLDAPGLDRLLRSVVEAAVALFDAEAASIALVEPDGRLRFRVAAGAQGAGVVGLTVAPGEGIAGFVVSTAQPIAVSNVAADPRFDREAATRTGYGPRSLLAVPLEVDDRVIGVLEVLDRRGAAAFDLRDVALAGVFARQAATAIDVSRVERDVVRLVARGLSAAAGDGGASTAAEDVAADAVRTLDAETTPAFWGLVERLASLRAADPGRIGLVADMLDAAIRHLAVPSAAPEDAGGPGRRRTWRDRAAADSE